MKLPHPAAWYCDSMGAKLWESFFALDSMAQGDLRSANVMSSMKQPIPRCEACEALPTGKLT